MWQRVTQTRRFTLDDKKFYCEATTHIITGGSLKYILAILNSKAGEFFFYRFYQGGGIKGEIKGEFLKHLPIPQITPQNQPLIQKIEDLVFQILSLTQSEDYLENPQKQAKVKEYERQIDQLVYKLYDLTDEEIKIVEEEIR